MMIGGNAERYFFNIELQTNDLVDWMTDNIKIEELD